MKGLGWEKFDVNGRGLPSLGTSIVDLPPPPPPFLVYLVRGVGLVIRSFISLYFNLSALHFSILKRATNTRSCVERNSHRGIKANVYCNNSKEKGNSFNKLTLSTFFLYHNCKYVM